MRRDFLILSLVLAIVGASACSGDGESVSTPVDSLPTATAPDDLGGVPLPVVAAVHDLLADSALATLSDDEIAGDIAAACTLAASPDPAADGFLAGLASIIVNRTDAIGAPPDGEESARYAQAIGAAASEVCSEEMGAALLMAAPTEGTGDYEDRLASGLQALSVGLEGSPFEGLPDTGFTAEEIESVFGAVCGVFDRGEPTETAVDLVIDDVVVRYGVDQPELETLIMSIITTAAIFLCPQHSGRVLGP